MNVFEDEVARYDDLSKTWASGDGPLSVLRPFCLFKANWIRKRCRKPKPTRALDVGCGGGYLSFCVSDLCPTVGAIDAIDVSAASIKENRKNLQSARTKINFATSTLEQWAAHCSPQAPKYDLVLCSELIEHVPRPLALLAAADSVLKPGGYIFISTPAKTWLSRLLLIHFAERVLRVIPRHSHRYDRFVPLDDVMATFGVDTPRSWLRICGTAIAKRLARKRPQKNQNPQTKTTPPRKPRLVEPDYKLVALTGTLVNPLTHRFYSTPFFRKLHWMTILQKQ